MTEKRERRASAGAKTVGRPHSLKADEIRELLLVWGIIGAVPERRVRVVRLPQFDKGPGDF